MIILSLDLGKDCGIAVRTNQGIEFTEEYKFKNFSQLQTYVKHLIMLWKPDLVLCPYPTRFYNTILKHGKMLGVICAVCELRDIPLIEVQDKSCKKLVIGKGNAKKKDIAEYYKEYYQDIDSEHIFDAIMFIDWYLKAVETAAKRLT